MPQISDLFKFGPFELHQRLDALSLSYGDSQAWQSSLTTESREEIKTAVYTQLLQHFEHSDVVSQILGHFHIHQSLDAYLDTLLTQELEEGYIEGLAQHILGIAKYEEVHEYYSIVSHVLHRCIIDNLASHCRFLENSNSLERRLQLDLSILLQFLHIKSIEDSRRYASLMQVRDPLTDLYNHNTFPNELEKMLARCKRHKTSALVLDIHLEGLGAINRRLGYEAGDTLLQSFAFTAQELIRQSDLIARGSRGNFYFVLEDTTNRDGKAICERLISAVDGSSELPITLQIGGASYSSDSDIDGDELLGLAHEHMELARARSLINHRHEYSVHFDSKDNLIQLIKG
ncbi:GGDEF domain-containing protein [Vibrio coralliilyticus]|uniref:GGDEF domain-containing protein n=1 Tax=Vibrio coralliilyticus TaxID=190893 RepID=UPI0015617177|nr:GGDEF domain-containing protein [Vibrio coralliilyticus]NRF12869.1 GGDEF domain-containing protein [Vibrio coralliilyticus]